MLNKNKPKKNYSTLFYRIKFIHLSERERERENSTKKNVKKKIHLLLMSTFFFHSFIHSFNKIMGWKLNRKKQPKKNINDVRVFRISQFFSQCFSAWCGYFVQGTKRSFCCCFCCQNMILIWNKNIVRAGHIYQTKTKVPNIQINKQTTTMLVITESIEYFFLCFFRIYIPPT